MRDIPCNLASAGLACLLAVFGVMPGVMPESGSISARAESVATPMAAVPGMLKKTGHEGPWGYGCAFPDGGSQAKGVTCTLGRILVGENATRNEPEGNGPKNNRSKNGGIGKGRPGGMLMLLRATPDSARQKLEDQPWALAFLLPPEQSVDRAVPARLVVDHAAALSIPWQGCTAQGCSAELPSLPDEAVFGLNHGRLARVTAQKPDGGHWVFDVPLDNLQAAMRQMAVWTAHDALKP